jgi:hypothetical protein
MKRTFVLLGALLLAGGFCPTMAWGSPELQSISQKSNTVTGTIVDEKGEPVVGASIQERGTNRGTVTDSNGHFSLSVNPNAQITISYLGYKTVTRKASANMNIALDVDQANLDEVVVVGYGQQKKANLTGAVSSVDIDKTFRQPARTGCGKALQGRCARSDGDEQQW